MRSAPDEGAPATAEGALCAFDRDDDEYWKHERPADHGANGLYRYGPQPGLPMTSKLAALTRTRCRERAPAPTDAHAQMRHKTQRVRKRLSQSERARLENLERTEQARLQKLERLRRGIRGASTPAPRRRASAA